MTLDAIRLNQDELYFYDHLIEIEDRNGKIVRFKLNPAQELLHNETSNRILVVKAGQLGITTKFLAKAFHKTITRPNTTSVIVAHEEFLTQRLLNRVKVWYDRIAPQIALRLPDGSIETLDKPFRKHNSANETSFPLINSVFYIGTARAFVFGRGEPIHNFHGSEVAFWPDPWKILRPTMQRVPLEGFMVVESTPNGEIDSRGDMNAFYQLVTEASGDPNSVWKLVELPWWLEPEYKIPLGSAYALPRDQGKLDFTEEEALLSVRANWTWEEAQDRIRWRRRKQQELKEEFWQEFFEDISSCFLTTGAMYYDVGEMDRLRRQMRDPIDRVLDAKIWYYPDDDWELPNYHISVDPGQGKQTYSVATVWRIDMPSLEFPLGMIRHEATLAGLYDPVAFAPKVKALGSYYKKAKIAAERNGHGMAFCAEIRDYPNLYHQKDVVSGWEQNVIGWKTTGAARIDASGTKTYMIERLNHDLPQILTHDADVINQIAQVRIGADGKIVIPKWDDFHDSAAIMSATRSSFLDGALKGFAFSKRR